MESYAVSASQGRENGHSINFRPEDLEKIEAAHDNALMIKTSIVNYCVKRVFIDTDSFVNIIFKIAFDDIQLDEEVLYPIIPPCMASQGMKYNRLVKLTSPSP